MKKFFATVTANVFATSVEASAVLSNAKFADELLHTAMAEGKSYVVKGDKKVSADLQEMFMDKLNDMINSAEEIGNTDMLEQLKENGHIAKDVYEWVIDTLEARKNPLSDVVVPVNAVTIASNVPMKEEQVLAGMAARGLVIGGTCETPNGEGTVLAFEVSSAGTIAYVERADGIVPLMVNVLNKNYVAPAAVAVQTKTNEEVSTMTNNNQSVNNVKVSLELAIDPAMKAAVDQAVANEVPSYELTAEERAAQAEMTLATDLAKFAANQEKKEENVSKLANSSEANALLNVLGATGATKTQAQAPAVSTGTPAVAPRSARQAAQTAVNATQNKTQTNGGNVQMKTQTTGAQTQGRTATPAPAAFAGQQATAGARLAAGAGLELAGNFAPALNAGFVFDTSDFELNEYVGRGNNGNSDFVWYLEAMKQYDTVMSAADFAANGRKNEALGITDIQLYSTEAVKALNSKRFFRDDEVMVMEVFFGATSYEFTFARRESDRGAYIFSRNIARKQRENGTGFYCEYTSSRRSDKLAVVVQSDGKIREARKVWDKEAKAFGFHAEDAAYVVEVGGETFIDANLGWNVKIGQAPFVQIMIVADSVLGLKKAREAKAQA